jgi:hypothetical protein
LGETEADKLVEDELIMLAMITCSEEDAPTPMSYRLFLFEPGMVSPKSMMQIMFTSKLVEEKHSTQELLVFALA